MTSIGTGYDLYASQFSPDGRVFQIEYADKAVENSGTAIGKFCIPLIYIYFYLCLWKIPKYSILHSGPSVSLA